MIYINKDITTVQAPALIAHGVNCSNAMGSGVALALYTKWPKVKSMYHFCYRGFVAHGDPEDLLGEVQFVEVEPGLVVANCFTQENYGRVFGKRYADPRAVKECLEDVARHAWDELALGEVHMPRIGSDRGGLDWEDDVVPILEDIEARYKVEFVVCDI